MELTKTKFKQTEVGLIPEDWDVKLINQICTVIRGASPRPKGDKRFYGGNIPRLMVEDVTRDGKFVTPQIDFLTFEGAKMSRPCPSGTLTIVCSGTVGIPSFLKVDSCIHDGFIGLINIDKKVSDDFLFHQFVSLKQSFDSSATHGGVFTNLTTTGVKEFRIPLPPTFNEQKAIATALSEVDQLIAKLEKLIEKKKAIKQGAMQALLTPPHKGGKRLDGFIGDWVRSRVCDVIKVSRGGSPRPIQDFITNSPTGINWIKIGDTSPFSKFINSSQEKIIEEGQAFSRNVFVGDFLLSNSMSFGRPYILNINGCIHDGWLVLQNYSDYFDKDFLYYTLMTTDVHSQYLMKASGSSVLNLNKELVNSVELNRPVDLTEQRAISKILSELDLEILAMEKTKFKVEKIKQGMMQELLTGRTRLV
jgi:type I restriction enzyme S subunit